MTTPQKINRYDIKNELGRGGMATVYEAYDPRFQRPVAVKVLPREFMHDPEFRARFTREARTIAALEHPAIVPVYDFGEEDGQPFLVMRLMNGGSLLDRLEKGPIDIDTAAEILKRIGSALDRAHQKGIIHRDLKPSNILFDQYGDAFLADFGIVRITSSSAALTASGSLVGTPTYMAPEQVYGNKELDGRADIYALGVILYQMLTGEIPYEADTPARMMMAHVMDPVPRILEKRPDLPPDCDGVITKAMAKEPDERFSTASDLTTALNDATKKTSPLPTVPPVTISPEPEPAAAAATAVAAPEAETTAPPQPEIAGTVPAAAETGSDDGSSFAEPTFASEIAATEGDKGSNIPGWIWILAVLLVLFCFAGAAGVGYLIVDAVSDEETASETATAVFLAAAAATTPPATTAGDNTVFDSLGEEADATSTPTEEPEVQATEPPPTGVTAESDALATREAAEATRAAGANSDEADVLATRQSLEMTRNAEEGGPSVEFDETGSGFGELDAGSALYGPITGELLHEPEDDTIEMFYPDIQPADFVLNAHFINPFSTEDGIWDFGVTFRQDEPDEEYRLVVRSDGLWNLNNRQVEGDNIVQEGNLLDKLDRRPAEANQITLLITGEKGYFLLNEEFITTLDLSDRLNSGDIALGTGFYTVDEQAGASTTYEDFAVWELDPDFGPAAGSLIHELDDLIKIDESGVFAENFIMSATFLNPFPTSASEWDIGFAFRDDDDGTKYWLVVASEGEWELVGRFGDSDTDTTLQDGELFNLNLGEGEQNELKLIVLGETGFFLLNDELIETLDLFEIIQAGDAEIITAFYFDHEIEGETTDYQAFTVWSLP